ncbi:MAG: hypothetical protein U0230_27155 [Polyangiales bacterium]
MTDPKTHGRAAAPRIPSLALLLVSSLPLGACSGKAPEPSGPAVRETAPPPPVQTICPADAAQLPALSLAAGTEGDHLVIEPLAQPTRGRCPHEHTLMVQPEAAAHRASPIRTAAGPYLAVNRILAAATVPSKNVVLIAAESGLWAHDVGSMARLARLVDRRVVDLTVSEDGTRFAYVAQDPVADAPRELVVVAVEGLAVLRRVANAPTGRVRLAADGSKVVFADGDEGVHLVDVRTGGMRSFKPNDTVEDAFLVPGTDATVAYVGDDNAIAYHDLAANRALPQSTAGALPLTARRDLRTVIVDATTGTTYAGGEDNEIHAYSGMLSNSPRETAHARLSGNVVDIACCSEDHLAVVTDVAHVAWLDRALEVKRQIGPFLPDLASSPARVSMAGDRTVVSLVGRAFVWTRDGLFVEPDAFVGEEVARVDVGGSLVIVLRSRGRLEFHRFAAGEGLERASTLLGVRDWALVDSSLNGPNGSHVFVGRAQGRVVAALVPPTGEAVFVRGPLVGVHGTPRTVRGTDDSHFGLWDLENQVLELDVGAQAFRVVGRIAGEPSTFTLSFESGAWKVVDANGRARAIETVAAAGNAPAPAAAAPATGMR